jgi:ribonuclease P protein component
MYRPITEDSLFRQVYRKGKRVATHHVVVYALRDWDNKRLRRGDPLRRPFNRVGLTVTKKQGNAVTRSRIRRILRAGYRAVEAEAGSGWLIVLSAREGAADAKSTDIARDLAYAFKKLSLAGTPRASDADKLPRTCVDTAAAGCLSGGAVAQSEKPPQVGGENTAAGDPSDACAQTQKEKIESAEQNTTTEAPQEGV